VSHRSFVGLLVAGAAVACAAMPATASAAEGSTGAWAAAANTPQGRLKVSVDVRRFRATSDGTTADGTATATLGGLGGLPTVVKKKVHLAAAKAGSCTILSLELDTLDLTLLGLNVHLDKVNLKLTGKRSGGVLGSLFCSLANAKVKTARVAAAARINRQLRKTGTLRPIGLTVPVTAVASQAATCDVLELTLGPLHVNLLGLFIDLNKVHLKITANAAGGVLGSLFCGLAHTPV
jgi:hypothetical protein